MVTMIVFDGILLSAEPPRAADYISALFQCLVMEPRYQWQTPRRLEGATLSTSCCARPPWPRPLGKPRQCQRHLRGVGPALVLKQGGFSEGKNLGGGGGRRIEKK